MTTDKKPAAPAVVSAVLPPEVTPAQILTLAASDLKDYRELMFDGAHGVGAGVLELIEHMVRGLGQASKRSEVNSIVYALAEACTKLETEPEVGNNCDAVSLTAITTEIERRQAWFEHMHTTALDKLSETIERVEEALAANKDNLRWTTNSAERGRLLTEGERLSVLLVRLKNTDAQLSEVFRQKKQELEELVEFHRAAKVVSRGYPKQLIDASLPDIHRLANAVEVNGAVGTGVRDKGDQSAPALVADADVVEGEESTTVALTTAVSPAPRRMKLWEIAEQAGLLEVEVFVYSLFDFFGTDNKWLMVGDSERYRNFKPCRGLHRVVNTALEVASGFGWKNHEEFFPESGWRSKHASELGFIRYAGSASGTAMWVRTEKPLPWDPKTIFTRDEIAQFVFRMREKVVFIPKAATEEGGQ